MRFHGSIGIAGLRAGMMVLAGLALGLAALPAGALAQGFGQGIAVGHAAPDFTAVSADGKPVKLSDYRGRTVVLEWTNNGCPFVRAQYDSGAMQRTQALAASQSVVWLTILSSAPGTQGFQDAAQAKADIAREKASPAAYLLDPEGRIGRLYGARTTPHMFVITPAQTIAYMGAIDDKPSPAIADRQTARNYVVAALQNLAAGKPAEPAATTPYGCTVKYSG